MNQLMGLISQLMYRYSKLADSILINFEERQKHPQNGAALKYRFYKLLQIAGRTAFNIPQALYDRDRTVHPP